MSKRLPTVDILLPVFGDAIYVGEALESLKPELNDHVKLIIILDRPNQATENKIMNFASKTPNTTFMIAEPKGLVGALNTGLFASQAKYIARMDSDDICLFGRIAAQIEWLGLKEDRILCGTQISYIDKFGKRDGRSTSIYPLESQEIIREMHFRNPFAHPSVMFNREKALEVGGYRDLYLGGEDLDLWFRLAKRGAIGNLAAVFLHYRITSTQFTKEITNHYKKDEPCLYQDGILNITAKQQTNLILLASSQLRSIERELNQVNLKVLTKILFRFTVSFVSSPSLAIYYARYRFRLRYSLKQRQK